MVILSWLKIESFEHGILFSSKRLGVITKSHVVLVCLGPTLCSIILGRKLCEGNSFSGSLTGISGCLAIIRKRAVTSQMAAHCGPYSAVGHFPRPALTSAAYDLSGDGDLHACGATEATGARWSPISPPSDTLPPFRCVEEVQVSSSADSRGGGPTLVSS